MRHNTIEMELLGHDGRFGFLTEPVYINFRLLKHEHRFLVPKGRYVYSTMSFLRNSIVVENIFYKHIVLTELKTGQDGIT